MYHFMLPQSQFDGSWKDFLALNAKQMKNLKKIDPFENVFLKKMQDSVPHFHSASFLTLSDHR